MARKRGRFKAPKGFKDHKEGFSKAMEDALEDTGFSPGRHEVRVILTALIDVTNPAEVVEYRIELDTNG